MTDINDDSKHIQSVEKFLQVCVERILDKNEKTNDKLYVIASSINAITEFIIAESRYSMHLTYVQFVCIRIPYRAEIWLVCKGIVDTLCMDYLDR